MICVSSKPTDGSFPLLFVLVLLIPVELFKRKRERKKKDKASKKDGLENGSNGDLIRGHRAREKERNKTTCVNH